jgi:hypothetical protein
MAKPAGICNKDVGSTVLVANEPRSNAFPVGSASQQKMHIRNSYAVT